MVHRWHLRQPKDFGIRYQQRFRRHSLANRNFPRLKLHLPSMPVQQPSIVPFSLVTCMAITTFVVKCTALLSYVYAGKLCDSAPINQSNARIQLFGPLGGAELSYSIRPVAQLSSPHPALTFSARRMTFLSPRQTSPQDPGKKKNVHFAMWSRDLEVPGQGQPYLIRNEVCKMGSPLNF